jgi:hypothetical protein
MTRESSFAIGAALLAALACQPKVSVEPPSEPIHVIVDVNIKHELRVVLEKDAEQLIAENEEIF